jgi:hypothetical protein
LSDRRGRPERALETAQRRRADGAAVEQERVAYERDKGLPRGKCMIFDARKSLRMAPLNCSATTLESSHEDDRSCVGMSASKTVVPAASGEDGGISAFGRTCGESVSRSGNVTFHTHSPHVLRLSAVPYNCNVLNNV